VSVITLSERVVQYGYNKRSQCAVLPALTVRIISISWGGEHIGAFTNEGAVVCWRIGGGHGRTVEDFVGSLEDTVISVSFADPVVMSSRYVGVTRSSCPQGYVMLSWAKVRLRMDYAMACLALFLALLVGVRAYDWGVDCLSYW
jgi:hypothetical protein